MSKHTPGPWQATFEDYRWIIDCQGEFGPKKALAVTAGFYPKHEGNARLIAAAPELLEALQSAKDFLAVTGFDSSDVYAEVSAAIKKSTGE